MAAKTRNSNSMTESAFFCYLRSALRKLSMRGWKPIAEIKMEARVPYTGDNKKRKYSYVCSICKKEVDGKSCAVHHIIPAGSLKTFEDLPAFCERLFVEKHGLMLICDGCHSLEHKKENSLNE